MNFKFDRTAFLSSITSSFEKMNRHQLDGFTFLLDRVECDDRFSLIQEIAYFFATAWHETAMTMQPIVENGARSYFNKYDTGRLAKLLGNTPAVDGDGYKYRGRGFVQNTGARNAAQAGRALAGKIYTKADGSSFVVTRTTFINDPELLLIPAVSYDDAVDGMFAGRYTGVGLSRYINENHTDYLSARRVINGQDCAAAIRKYALQFEAALDDSRIIEVAGTTIAIDRVIAPLPPAEAVVADAATAKVELGDITKHISGNTLRSVAPKVAVKASAGAMSLWGIGVHGKILLVLVVALLITVVGYELFHHRTKIRDAARRYLKGGDAK